MTSFYHHRYKSRKEIHTDGSMARERYSFLVVRGAHGVCSDCASELAPCQDKCAISRMDLSAVLASWQRKRVQQRDSAVKWRIYLDAELGRV